MIFWSYNTPFRVCYSASEFEGVLQHYVGLRTDVGSPYTAPLHQPSATQRGSHAIHMKDFVLFCPSAFQLHPAYQQKGAGAGSSVYRSTLDRVHLDTLEVNVGNSSGILGQVA